MEKFSVIKNAVGNYQVVNSEGYVYITTNSQKAAEEHKEELQNLYKGEK